MQRPNVGFGHETTLFLIANVLAPLTHLHGLQVAHRDIKTENLMVERDGYLKLIDLGFARHLPGVGRTISFCGTPFYMAPELITFRTHGLPVDIWALGILFFELVFGRLPFGEGGMDALDAFHEVMAYERGKSSLPFPVLYGRLPGKDAQIRELITELLHHDHDKRPTCAGATASPTCGRRPQPSDPARRNADACPPSSP